MADINSLVEWLSQDEIPRLTKGELTWELEKKWAIIERIRETINYIM